MKKLIFIRHGKAEDPTPGISDFERSLVAKGKIISRQMAEKFHENEQSPGILITSPAFRALETAIIFAQEFGIEPEKILLNSNLYYKMNFIYLSELLSDVSNDSESVTLFGHNPSFTEIADSLCTEDCGFIPKSGVVGISFNIRKWNDVRYKTGKLEYFLKPERVL